MMFRRGLALCLVLGLASFARAQQATISFSPNGGTFAPNQVVNVDVLVTQANGATKFLRYAQLDFSKFALDNPTLRAAMSLPTTHSAVPGMIKGFDFLSTTGPNCAAANSATCGTGHYVEDELVGGLRPNIIAIAYRELTADPNKQIELANNVATKIATLTLTMPAAGGNYGKLDVLNANGLTADVGGELRWGFGITGDTDLVRLRVPATLLGGLSGDFIVSSVINFVSALPAATASAGTVRVLSRTTRNEARLDFDGNLPAPPAGAVRVRELLAAGAFGPDIAANFTPTIGDAATPPVGDTARLILKDNASNLGHRKWYQVESTGTWPGVGPFCLQFVVQSGDCEGNGSVGASDLTCVNLKIPTPPMPAASDANFRVDINAAQGIGTADLNAANAQIASPPVAKPTGHTTCP